MNNLLNNATGIDKVIELLQNELYDRLVVDWVDDINGYGRVYRNMNTAMQYEPKWWNSTSLDYEDVSYNDAVSATFCFIDSDLHKTEDGEEYKSDVKCVFMVNLNKIFPSDTERADNKAQMDVMRIIQDNSYMFDIKSVEKGLTNVFAGFDTSKILNTDIQPKHCFSVNIKLSYYLNC